MNTDERRQELLNKANSLIDTISESMRTIENVESAKKKFLRPDSVISLELPIEGCGGMTDVFKLEEIFDERGVEKIKAYILNELEFLEENALKVLDQAGFHNVEQKPDNAPQKTEEKEDWIPFAPDPDEPAPEEDDSDMIIVPEKLEKKASKPRIGEETVQQMKELLAEGKNPLQISKALGVSHQSVARHLAKTQQESSGRSVSR